MTERLPTASSLLPTSLFDSIKTYLLNLDVSEYENELRKIDSLPVFDYGTATPGSLATPSYTDVESDGEEEEEEEEGEKGGEGEDDPLDDAEEEEDEIGMLEPRPRSKSFREPARVINLTPLNKDKSYSFLDEFFQSNTSPLYHPPAEETDGGSPPPTPATPGGTEKRFTYKVTDYDTLNSIALKFNVSPAVVKQHNALSSEVIFPGQALALPLEEAQEVEPDILPVLRATVPAKPPLPPSASAKKRFNKYEMRRITRFDGSVGGTTLLTSNAFIFRANVSDKLVIQNGGGKYNVSIPLDSVSEVLMFESFDQLLENIQATTMIEACATCSDVKQKLVQGCSSPEIPPREVQESTGGSEEEGGDIEMKEEEEKVEEKEEEEKEKEEKEEKEEEEKKEEDKEEEEEEDRQMEDYPRVKIINPSSSDFDNAFAGSLTPEANNVLADLMEATRKGAEVALGESPVKMSCEHEFQGYSSTKKRVNPFAVVNENLLIPAYNSQLDPLNPAGLKRVVSDTSLATQAFFRKIDENTSQMQSALNQDPAETCSVFVSIHAIICGRTHGKPCYQYETEEGYQQAYFWVCVREKDIVSLMDNFFSYCSHLSPVDDSSNCLLKCPADHYTRLSDVIHPEKPPTFVPREVDTGLVSEPFSGSLFSPPDKTVLLTAEIMGDLQPYLPCHVIGIDMHLTYSLSLHGMSLRSLYTACAAYPETPSLLVVKDTGGYVFGAYLSDGIMESPKYYGTGETFLFRHSPDLQCFFWQGENHYFMMGRSDYFTIGAGDGNFALYLDEMLQRGTSNRSLTFYNEVLSSRESFDILAVEVWTFTDEPIVSDTDSLSSEVSRYSGKFQGNFYMR